MNKEVDFMLTTVDNPYNPFTQWEDWYKFDMISGHDCSGYLARVAKVSDKLSDELNTKEIYRAIDEIVKLEPMIYKKVSSETIPPTYNYKYYNGRGV